MKMATSHRKMCSYFHCWAPFDNFDAPPWKYIYFRISLGRDKNKQRHIVIKQEEKGVI